MATHRKSILNWATLPDTRLTTGNVTPEPTGVNLNSNDRYRRLCFKFANTATKDGLAGSFQVPKNYVGTAKIILLWASPTITGDVVWVFEYTAIAGSESADPSADQESATVTTTVDGTARDVTTSSITLTSGNFAVDDTVEFILSRNGAGSDTLADAAYLLSAEFEYADA